MNNIPIPALAAILTLPLSAAEQDWKLQRMPYNHPGLAVDLAVGLWAWPLPLDYDDDGDLDLLVACPDKPSNGIYFFENPGSNSKEKMPLFKPGIRLGPADHNLQVSHVDGQPRILVENREYVDFKTKGFVSPRTIYPNARFHPGNTRGRMWRYVDYDGDGDHDLIAGIDDWSDYVWDQAYDNEGRWRNGPLHGFVYFIENVDGAFPAKPVQINAGGSPVDVFGWPSPNFGDFDGDGDLDLLCGEFLDGFTYFENTGTRREPVYGVGRRLSGSDGRPLVMHLQMITPTAIDWDRDSDLDLIVGDEDGRVALVEHTGQTRAGLPVFQPPAYFRQEADTLKFGALSTPFVVDWDADGDQDLLCGNTAGNIAFFENLGMTESGTPKWNAPALLRTADGAPYRVMAGPNGSVQGPCEAKWGYTSLSVADWDGDGKPDVICNSILGRISLLLGTGDPLRVVPAPFDTGIKELPPKWQWWQSPASDTLTQWRTTPLVIDYDGDKKLDLVALDQEGVLVLRRGGKSAERIFVDEDLRPLTLNGRSCGASGRAQLAMTDWDRDGNLDLLVNSQNAVWYRNVGKRDGRVILKKIGNVTDRDVSGHNTCPTVADFNGDGDPELVLGAEDGRIYHLPRKDGIVYSAQNLQPRPPADPEKPRFPGLVKEEFLFQKAPFPQCHASTLAETARGLVAAWFGGSAEGKPNVSIWSNYFDGVEWTKPLECANGIQYEGKRWPCWNPVLWQAPGDGPLHLFFKVGPSPQSWWGELMVSYDGGRSFRNRRRLPEGIDGPVRGKPLPKADGTLLCPSSTEHGGDWRFHFEILENLDRPELGASWERHEPETQPYQVIQPTVLTLADGTLRALYRSKNKKIITNHSRDGGRTWSALEETNLPNNNSGVEGLTLKDGRHLLLYNHLGGEHADGWGKRNVLNLAVSKDGLVWEAVAFIEKEEKGEFSYPAMIQTRDGRIHLTYTWNRTKVKHVVIAPESLEPQPIGIFEPKAPGS
ncbi:MAG: putative neuraminidase (sialidase) [Verrucomicrobia bacterium]|nr:MAG: putative neuraminidase (sialidase) [Verrucomicrobiota bacterium]